MRHFDCFIGDFIDRYFLERQKKQDAGLDPNDVKLVILNNVDDLAYQIVPQSFRLMRSKTKPLLYQYDFTAVIVGDLNEISNVAQELVPAVRVQAKNWLLALKDRAGTLTGKLQALPSAVCQDVATFIDGAVSVLETAKSGVGDIANFVGGITDSIKLVLDATRDTQAFINDLPFEAIIELNELTSVIGEVNCYLKNGFKESWLPDFSGVCGCDQLCHYPWGSVRICGE